MKDSYNDLIEQAYNFHINGNIDEAKVIYEKLLSINPKDIDVLNLYAQLQFSLKNYTTALEIFKELYEITKLDDIKINLAQTYFALKDFDNVIKIIETVKEKNLQATRLLAQSFVELKDYKNAINIYLTILEMPHINKDDIFNLSVLYSYEKDYENSLKYAQMVYNNNNNDFNLCCHIASIYNGLNDNENQLKFLLKAKQIYTSADILYNIGILYSRIGDDENAIKYFEDVIAIEPEHKLAYLNIAKIYLNYDKNISIEIYSKLAEKYPNDLMILIQLYITYREMLNYELAYDVSLKIIEKEKEKSYPYTFAAEALIELGKYDEAISMLKTAKTKKECNIEYCDISLAEIYSVTNRNKMAIEIFETKYPQKMTTNGTYAWAQLRDKNLEKGAEAMHNSLCIVNNEDFVVKRAVRFFYKLNLGKEYNINEFGFKQFKPSEPDNEIKRVQYYLQKDLFSNNPDNKKILLYNAHGVGDMFMFSRYIHILENHTKQISIQAPKSTVELMRYNFPNYDIFPDDSIINIDDYDYTSDFVCLMCSLKEISLKSIPFSSSYFNIPEKIVKEKSELEIMKTNKKKIGIFWMGNPLIMPQRSIKLKELEKLFEIDNTQIYSFQLSELDYESDQLKQELPLIDLSSYIKNYMDTAGFLKNIDVLVTIDSSIANLSGALGVRTFLLLPYKTEWRWFYDTDKTSWYDSVRIFKQEIPYHWDSVIERVKNELTI